jgi:hypothetical protein
MQNGKPTTLTGAFQDASPKSLQLAWKRASFAALVAEAHPQAKLERQTVFVYGEPGGKDRATNGTPPTLSYLSDGADSDISLDLAFGDPFPASWAAIVNVAAVYTVESGGQTTEGSISMSAPLEDFPGSNVAPPIGPPRNLEIDGKDASVATKLGDGDPTLTWTPPGTGTPAGYSITVSTVDSDVSGIPTPIALILTTETHVTIPSTVMKAAGQYWVEVSADTELSLEAPQRFDNKRAQAATTTGLLSR